MRWRKKYKQHPKDGDTRIVSRFLIFPECLENEYRWFEFTKIIQKYRGIECIGNNIVGGYWVDVNWFTDKNKSLKEETNNGI